jgi:hypothetical protein
VALGVYDAAIAALAIQGEFRELAHIRGIAPVEEACEPLMSVLASLLERRFALRLRPQIYLNGAPFNAG